MLQHVGTSRQADHNQSAHVLDRAACFAETPPMAPGFGWCAWCGEVILTFYVDNHGTRYHVGCYALRESILRR